MSKILVVEDDQVLATVLNQGLEDDHYVVEVSHDAIDALERLKHYVYDLIILDWELPFKTGIEVCREFRAKGGTCPVLMLTGKSKIDEKEMGFNTGVDDYLTKPFEIRELKLRIKALLKRSSAAQEDHTLRAGDIILDPQAHTATKNGKPINLSPKEFALLEFFLRHPEEVFSAEYLLKAIWNADEAVGSETIRTHMKNLRQKIETKGKPAMLDTVFGVGYKFVPPADH